MGQRRATRLTPTFWSASPSFARTCPDCRRYVDVGVVLRGGVIEEVRAFVTGLPDCDVSLLGGAGQVTPRPEWSDHPMTVVDGGDREWLVTHRELRA